MDFFPPTSYFAISTSTATVRHQIYKLNYDFIIFDLLVDYARANLSGVPLRPKPLRR